MKTHMTLERGILFFEDGTEVSNVSVEMIQALPDLLKSLNAIIHDIEGYETRTGIYQMGKSVNDARRAIAKATPANS